MHDSPCGGAAGGTLAARACVTRQHVTRFGCFMEPGCGSGVLSLCAALAGAVSVIGTDIDPEALLAAR